MDLFMTSLVGYQVTLVAQVQSVGSVA